MSDVFGTAADWLEHGRPGERESLAEAARLGELLWAVGGVRAYGRQDADAYRLSIVGADSRVTYEVAGIEGGWMR